MTRSIRAGSDLILVAVIAAACACAAYVPGAEPARAALGVLLGLGGLGYALGCAAWGARRPEGAEMLLYSMALSLAGAIVTVLAMNEAGVALTQTNVTVVLVNLTFVALLFAWLRRADSPAFSFVDLRVAVLAAAVPLAVFVTGLIVLDRPIANDRVAGYTQLSSLRAADGTVNVGITNAELVTVGYVLKIAVPGRPAIARSIRLQSGAAWRRSIKVSSGSDRPPVTVTLFRNGESRPYRMAYLAP